MHSVPRPKALLHFFFLVGLLSCQKEIQPPIVAFDIPSSEIKAGDNVVFVNRSENATSSEWDFGDESGIVKTNDQEVSHNFRKGGTFNVRLIAKNADGSQGLTKSVTVKESVVPLAQAIFEIEPSAVCNAPCTINVVNNSVNATSYSWEFPGGNPATSTSTSKRIQVVYQNAGDYTVKLTARGTGGAGESSATKTLKVNPPQNTDPSAAFDFSGANCVAPCKVKFVDKSQNAPTLTWNFGDGSLSTSPSPEHEYTTPGAYYVFLIAQNGTKTDVIKKLVNVYAKCVLARRLQDHPVTGDFIASHSYDSNDFPTAILETATERSGTKISEVKHNYSYKDGYVTGHSYSINLRNDNQQYVDVTTGSVKYNYNADQLLGSFEVTTVSMRDRNIPSAGTITSKSTTSYSYHPNYMLSQINQDGIRYNFSDKGELVSIDPASNNPSESYEVKDGGTSRTYKTTRYILSNGRISKVEYTNGAFMDWTYDRNGQLTRKAFNAPDLGIVDYEEWTYDGQKAISSLNRVFLGHPTYTVQGRVNSNVALHVTYRMKNGSLSGRRNTLEDVKFSDYMDGLPVKSNSNPGDNTYEYRCAR